MKFEKKHLYIVGAIVSITLIWLLFFKKSKIEIYTVYDTFEGLEEYLAQPTETKELSSGSNEENAAIANQLIDGYEGFELVAEKLGWQTNTDIVPSGSVKAIKGGTFRFLADDQFPPNLRSIGKDSRDQFRGRLEALIYQNLLSYNVETNKFEPKLATHWKIEKDSLTYYFRIDPRARFSDGEEVTANDVVATIKLLSDKGHGEPNDYKWWPEKFEVPEAISKYIVKFKAKNKEWKHLLSLAAIYVYPEHYLNQIDGAQFLTMYQTDFMPGSGPYNFNKDRTTKEGKELVVLDRKKDWWAKDQFRNIGLYNFDILEFIFIKDPNQKDKSFFNEEFDTYSISRAKWWTEKYTANEYDEIKRGLVQRQKFINYKPEGPGGISFNTRKFPFDDIKVREAFCHLWDIDYLMDNVFFREYVRKNSHFHNTKYANPNNPILDYNPELAVKILNEAGWSLKDGDQWMTNNEGKEFIVTQFPIYSNSGYVYDPLIEDLKRIGIKLEYYIHQNPFEIAMERKHQIFSGGWVGSHIPGPEHYMHSKYADVAESSNYIGIDNKEIDNLLEKYDKEWDAEKRIKILQEIDLIATNQYYWLFSWAAPYGYRSLNWNKFGMPKHGLGYSGGWLDPMIYWWIDPEKEQKLKEAKKNTSSQLEITNEVIDFYNILK